MNARSEVQFFLAEDRQIFSIVHPPTGPSRDEGVIICYPGPQEIMRSHAAHVQLSRFLAALGYTVLRFDYSSTGDSDGDSRDMSLDRWERDTLAAIHFMKQTHGLQRITLIGTRLGAILALRASLHGGIAQLILWDPVIDGLSYIQQLESSHRAMLEREQTEAPFASSSYSADQCWGFPWTAAFKAELAAISPTLLSTYAKKLHIVTTQGSYESWTAQLDRNLTELTLHPVTEDLRWGDDRAMRIRSFPSASLRALTRILGGS